MSYTTKIKEEISQIKNSKSESIAELSGFLRNNATYSNEILNLTSENKTTINRIKGFFKDLYQLDLAEKTIENLNFSKKDLFCLTLNNSNTILQDLGYLNEFGQILSSPPTYIVGANEEIRAYLRGVFLCVGSINDPKTSRYHMELLINMPEEAVFIQKLLNIFDLNAKILNRDKGYMIYIKEAEKISDYLKILGANNAVLYFEDVRIYREQKNNTNRLNNCEQANMDRIIQTATTQLEEIEIIEKYESLDLLDEKTKETLEYRKKYPEASLKELAEIISLETGKTITKSGLNHRLRKIKDLAERLTKNSK